MKKVSKKNKILILLIVLLVLVGAGLLVFFLTKKEPVVEEPKVVEPVITNTIEKYGYNLEERDSTLFKETFEELKTLLNTEDYDKEEYIKLVSKLFIIDLYTINNKTSRYDIGGLEYMYANAKDSFKSVVLNSIYNTVENNLDNNRTQKLPEVSSIEVTSISPSTYKMPDETTVDAYTTKLSWTYIESLGYDTSATLILIKDNNKYSVVYYKP
jgi:flagellar basal body-associated protein FliL